MKLFLFVFVFANIALFSMDRQYSAFSIESQKRSPFGSEPDVNSHQSSSSEEDDLCDFAISKYVSGIAGVEKYIKPFLKPLLQDAPLSPDLRHNTSNADILRTAKASERDNSCMAAQAQDVKAPSSLSVNDQRVYDMIVKAMHSAVEDKERELAEKERQLVLREARIREKYSGKKTAAIAAATGTISTIVTTICATMVTLNSK